MLFGQIRLRRDLTSFKESLMVLIYLFQIVQIVHHHPAGLLHTVSRQVSHEVQPFQPSAVAKVETSHRVQGPVLVILGFKEVAPGERH
tara:strand:- start:152 stop:415 length:264 start_codon:yes stop_codon:yes gene_type:complete